MIVRNLFQLVLALTLLIASSVPVLAREGDTLEPIQIDAPALETWPEQLLTDSDAELIEQRVYEARSAGVPVAVRIVDLSQPEQEIPFQLRQYVRDESDQPLSEERQQAMAESWIRSEPIETSEGANDGFLLLILVPEDRTMTQAVWWIGPNALPLNGLTQENILATHAMMNTQFVEANIPYGVFLGISEFSYNVQFGVPERLERTDLQNALRWATIPMAILTTSAGIAIPLLAMWMSRRNAHSDSIPAELSPWDAAALEMGRARPNIPAAMLLDGFHKGAIQPLADGGLRIETGYTNAAIDVLRPFADQDGTVAPSSMYEVEAICSPVRDDIEARLTSIGAMTPNAQTDRTRMLVLMGVTAFLAAVSAVPSVVSMSAPGIFAIAIGLAGIGIGWWWLAYRSYTSPAGNDLLIAWKQGASDSEWSAFDFAVHQRLLTDQSGGPDVTSQTRFVRQLRGLGSN